MNVLVFHEGNSDSIPGIDFKQIVIFLIVTMGTSSSSLKLHKLLVMFGTCEEIVNEARYSRSVTSMLTCIDQQ